MTDGSSGEYHQCDESGISPKHACTGGGGVGSPYADPVEQPPSSYWWTLSQCSLYQCDGSELDALEFGTNAPDGYFAEPPISGWSEDDLNHGSVPSLDPDTLHKGKRAACHAEVIPESMDLTLPDAEDTDAAATCTEFDRLSDTDGGFSSVHNPPDTTLSNSDGDICETGKTISDEHKEKCHDTCFGFVGRSHRIPCYSIDLGKRFTCVNMSSQRALERTNPPDSYTLTYAEIWSSSARRRRKVCGLPSERRVYGHCYLVLFLQN
jgi:hypothetical protein